MSLRNRLRVLSFRFRRSADVIFRETECTCDRLSDGSQKAGDIWHEEQGNEVWVNLAVEYFDNPLTTYDKERVEKIFNRCQLDAEQWLHVQYPSTDRKSVV